MEKGTKICPLCEGGKFEPVRGSKFILFLAWFFPKRICRKCGGDGIVAIERETPITSAMIEAMFGNASEGYPYRYSQTVVTIRPIPARKAPETLERPPDATLH